MTMSGLVLITICLANVLAVQAGCCNCDCQAASRLGLHQPHLYYLPLPSYQQSTEYLRRQEYHRSGTSSVASNDHQTLFIPTAHAEYQSAGQYKVAEEGEKSLTGGSQIQTTGAASGHENLQQRLYTSIGQQLDVSQPSNNHLAQQQFSKVSTHLDTHYINIEKKITPSETSTKDNSDLDHEKDHHHHHHDKDDYYKFEYSVNDQKTHDIKSHKEEKKGDVVQGEYSLLEDDGNVRTVKYYADWKTGFHAQVHNSKKTSIG